MPLPPSSHSVGLLASPPDQGNESQVLHGLAVSLTVTLRGPYQTAVAAVSLPSVWRALPLAPSHSGPARLTGHPGPATFNSAEGMSVGTASSPPVMGQIGHKAQPVPQFPHLQTGMVLTGSVSEHTMLNPKRPI
jgi:hypothetical protein